MPSPLVKQIRSKPQLARAQLSDRNPFVLRVGEEPSASFPKKLLGKIMPFFERLLGLDILAQGHEQLPHDLSERDFLRAVLEAFKIDYHTPSRALEKIPKTGPVVIVANHPFGGLEGMVLTELVNQAREGDGKVLVNSILGRIQELRNFFICVDPFGGNNAARANVQPLKAAIKHVQNGGLLATFPSGTVSHFSWRKLEVTDPQWNLNTATIIRRAKAAVVPVYFHGRNSLLFQILGIIHPLLRTLRLPRELLDKYGSRVRFEVGYPIPWARLEQFETDEELLAYIRLRTFILRNRPQEEAKPADSKKFARRRPERDFEPIVAPQPHNQLVEEIARIPPHQRLIDSSDFSVYFAYASQIPSMLQEIGRLREITFRQADEGTGKSIDLDRFDNYYVHLFSWCKSEEELVGAYRLGRVDSILDRYGMEGLYTNTLFHYSNDLIDQLGPSLELGRSFVRVEYQKNYWSLLFLWKGIGHFVARNPQYRNLFGPVSINNNYDSVSRHLIRVFLEQNNYSPELARLVRPRNAPPETAIRGVDLKDISTVVRDLKDVSQLLSDIESRPEVVPVLLRQYLKLGGRMLGFNVDPEFGDVLDGLVVVDLLETEPKMLVKYMGPDGLKTFFEHHGRSISSRNVSSSGVKLA